MEPATTSSTGPVVALGTLAVAAAIFWWTVRPERPTRRRGGRR